jgi:hypothetical protein
MVFLEGHEVGQIVTRDRIDQVAVLKELAEALQQPWFSLEERTALSETVASVTLAGVILMSALAFVVSGAHVSWLPWVPLR